MSEQPYALKLADDLVEQHDFDFYKVCEEAATELRRLHAEVERLRADRDEAARAEREACAKVCEKQAQSYNSSQYTTNPLGGFRERHSAEQCAAAIRARGQEPPR